MTGERLFSQAAKVLLVSSWRIRTVFFRRISQTFPIASFAQIFPASFETPGEAERKSGRSRTMAAFQPGIILEALSEMAASSLFRQARQKKT